MPGKGSALEIGQVWTFRTGNGGACDRWAWNYVQKNTIPGAYFITLCKCQKCFCCLGRHRCLPHLFCPDRESAKQRNEVPANFENVSLQRTSESSADVQFSHHFLNAFLTPALNGRRRRKLTAKLSSLYVVTLPCILWKYFSSSPLDFRSGRENTSSHLLSSGGGWYKKSTVFYFLFSLSPQTLPTSTVALISWGTMDFLSVWVFSWLFSFFEWVLCTL